MESSRSLSLLSVRQNTENVGDKKEEEKGEETAIRQERKKEKGGLGRTATYWKIKMITNVNKNTHHLYTNHTNLKPETRDYMRDKSERYSSMSRINSFRHGHNI